MYNFSDLIGKAFEYGGRGPDSFDCYGLAKEVFKRAGRELPEVNSPTEFNTIHNVGQDLKELISVEVPEPEPFCIVGFMIRPPFVSHMGIVLEDGFRFIHVLENTLVCIERLDNATWKDKIGGFYRITQCQS